MINSETKTADLGMNVAGAATFNKQPIFAAKKVALRDVQNNNSNLSRDTHPAILLPVEGQSFMDSTKISGVKRHTPDYDLNGNSRRISQLNGKKNPNSKTSVPRYKESNEDQMTDRFIRLQNFIKQCDGSKHKENLQLLLRLSPMELSKHAVELEKRAIQLTIEEGQEMQRMQALNILGTQNKKPIAQHKN